MHEKAMYALKYTMAMVKAMGMELVAEEAVKDGNGWLTMDELKAEVGE